MHGRLLNPKDSAAIMGNTWAAGCWTRGKYSQKIPHVLALLLYVSFLLLFTLLCTLSLWLFFRDLFGPRTAPWCGHRHDPTVSWVHGKMFSSGQRAAAQRHMSSGVSFTAPIHCHPGLLSLVIRETIHGHAIAGIKYVRTDIPCAALSN